MELQALTPMLRTWDLPATRAFYTGVLGFTCDSQSPTWASLKRNRVALMITTPNNHEGDRAPAFTGSLYFRTDQVDELWRTLNGKVRICYPIESFPYGMREFAIYGNNGYLLQFGQPIAT